MFIISYIAAIDRGEFILYPDNLHIAAHMCRDIRINLNNMTIFLNPN